MYILIAKHFHIAFFCSKYSIVYSALYYSFYSNYKVCVNFSATSISFLYTNYMGTFKKPYIDYLYINCLQNSFNLTLGIFKLSTYKYLHSLIFDIRFLT